MNGPQQKAHTTRVQLIADAAADGLERVRESIGAERTARLKLADEQRSYVDALDRDLRRVGDERWQATAKAQVKIIALSEPLRRGFWGRVNWLVTGR